MSHDERQAGAARQRPPTEDTVRRLVGAAYAARARRPDGAAPSVPLLRPACATRREGFSWWVGSGHVLRLAPDPDASILLRREIRLRDLVRAEVRVAVPVSVAAGSWTDGLAYTLDTRLPGSSAEGRGVSAAGEVDLAGLLGPLGAVPVARAVAAGLPMAPARSLGDLRAEAVAAARSLAGAGRFGAGRFTALTSRGLAQLTAPAHGSVVHGGLTARRLRVTEDGRVRGVLGWNRCFVGDPAEDIATLARALGAPIAVRAATLAGYGARECLRGLWLARCDTVIRLAALPWERRGRWDDAASAGRTGRTGHGTPSAAALRTQFQYAWEPILLERLSEDVPGEG